MANDIKQKSAKAGAPMMTTKDLRVRKAEADKVRGGRNVKDDGLGMNHNTTVR